MTIIMGYLPRIQQLQLQGVNIWWYRIGVGRVQVRFELEKLFFFADEEPQILAVSAITGRKQRFDLNGGESENFKNTGWASCQVGQTRLFQVNMSKLSAFRILKIEPTQRCFSIERQGDIAYHEFSVCLANFKDEFVFLFSYD